MNYAVHDPIQQPTLQAPAAAPTPRRRFRASDVVTHLDMVVIGDVCVGVSLAGYRSVLAGFLNEPAGSQAQLLAALEAGDIKALGPRAHAVKGAAASMGLRAIHSLALQIESQSADWCAADCQEAATTLRERLATVRALLQRMGFA